MQWNAIIFGPDGTVWDGGVFKLTMEFSEDYPNKAPVVKFRTRMFHPNSERLARGVGPGLGAWLLAALAALAALALAGCHLPGRVASTARLAV